MSFLLAQLTWPEARYLLKQAKAAVVPVGGVVQHGPHLPLEIDSLVVEHYAHQVATRLYPYIVVTPTLPFGVAERHIATPGTLTLKRETLSNMVFEIASSLGKHGLKKIVLFNGHPESKQALEDASERLKTELNLEVMTIHLRELFPEKGEEFLESESWSHASELETSEALSMFPDRVKKDRIQGADDSLGVEGKASSATPEKGKRLVDSIVEIVVKQTEDFML